MKEILSQTKKTDALFAPQDRSADDLGHEPLVSLNDCCRLTSLSRTAINRWRSLGMFPSAVALGEKRIAFVRSEVEQWVRDRIAERDRAALRKTETKSN
ncbi:AlpA family phage regulatory protein [Mesorhizobium sp. M0644]|uniref:helix-turn-helix transcriptional regulator n=1 Tax=Mesorhizobium sp. M0644 TaxID=2956979 RepID=UPI003335BABB